MRLIYENLLKISKVYKLSFKMCGLSYIGQTSDQINTRFNNLKSDIRHCKTDKEEQENEIKHFSSHGINNIEY